MVLYRRTIAFILNFIELKDLKVGDKLPNEAELSALAGVSMVTLRRALSELEGQGIVRREQGRGTFLARSRAKSDAVRAGSLRNGMILDARSPLTTRLLDLSSRPATTEEGRRLHLARVVSVWEIVRLRLFDDRPVIQETSIIPMILAPDLGNLVMRRPAQPLNEMLEAEYGLKEVREEQTLVCRKAGEAEARWLGLPELDWIVEISGISFSDRNVPIDSFRMIFDARAFAFRLETVRAAALEAIERA